MTKNTKNTSQKRPITAPMIGNPKILADWLERRTGGRDNAYEIVRTLFDFYYKEEKKRAGNKPTRIGDVTADEGPIRGS
jgi:hypothetical protein